ncbi:hypothetical protein Pelo_5833 [Pelomyxa schiedti]|nr:hypothetical protein Pelo_5833 [Pelomyxa schiedti]
MTHLRYPLWGLGPITRSHQGHRHTRTTQSARRRDGVLESVLLPMRLRLKLKSTKGSRCCTFHSKTPGYPQKQRAKRMTEAESRLPKLQKEIAKMKIQMVKMKGKMAETKSQLASLVSENATRWKENEALEVTLLRTKTQITELTRQVNEATKQVKDVMSQLNELRKDTESQQENLHFLPDYYVINLCDEIFTQSLMVVAQEISSTPEL